MAIGVCIASLAITDARYAGAGRAMDSVGAAQVAAAARSGIVPVSPIRLVDTRISGDTLVGGLPAGVQRSFDVARVFGPTPAVLVNVTLVGATGPTDVVLWADGQPRPWTVTARAQPGRAVAAMALVEVGANGRVSVMSADHHTELIIDVAGVVRWDGGGFHPLGPVRWLDTRTTARAAGGLAPVDQWGIVASFAGGQHVSQTHQRAIIATVTVLDPTAAGYVVAHALGAQRPATSNLNFAPGESTSNTLIIPVDDHGRAVLAVIGPPVHMTVDVFGYIDDGSRSAGSTLLASAVPTLLRDLAWEMPLGMAPGERRTLAVVGTGQVPIGAKAAVVSIRSRNNTMPLTVLAGPSGAAIGEVVQVAPMTSRPVTAVVPLGANGHLDFQTVGSWADLSVTLLGWTG